MGYHDLFVSQSNVFGGVQKSFEEADRIVLGVPFDATSTYRPGARFGPSAIREASVNIEGYSFRTGLDIKDLSLHDLGDLEVSSNTKETLNKLRLVIQDILGAEKTPMTIGGEHTVTLGVLGGLEEKALDTAIVSFDAHLDLRDEFLGLDVSHTTFMRRINEDIKPAKIVEVGTRAVCREELDYAKEAGIEFLTTYQVKNEGSEQIAAYMKKMLTDYDSVYLSVDMDVLDPAYAPAVQNPEPEGLETQVLMDIIHYLCDRRVIGFDIVEVAPRFDNGISVIQAAKIAFEILCSLEED
ncbi:agmatinase [Candidatus Bathyarchaeota archaeon]|nr:agmatinase [Candidatus Bathyarchaeota archaeon]